MTTTTDHGFVLVDILDPTTGEDTGRTAAVECWWATDYDSDYGADADGHRGVCMVDTITVLDIYMNPALAATMNSAQVEQVVRDARTHLERGGRAV